MTRQTNPQVERVRVTVDTFFHHRSNHTPRAPDPDCRWCEPWVSKNQRYFDGVIYRPEGDTA